MGTYFALGFEDIRSLDPRHSDHVLDYIRCNHLVAPSEDPYALTESEPSDMGSEIRDIFQNKVLDVFVTVVPLRW